MKNFWISLLVALSLLSFSSLGLSRRNLTTQEIEQMLLKLPVDYSTKGIVAEEVARITVYQLFPIEEYEIRRGLQYFDSEGLTAGELDIVVFERSSGKVVMVGEVKSGSSEAGIRKALQQKERFLEYMKKGLIAKITLQTNPDITFDLSRFAEFKDFRIIGVVGQQHEELLDMTLGLDRRQMNELSRRLKDFQRYRWKSFRKRTGQNINFHTYLRRLGNIDTFDFTSLFEDYNCARAF